MISNSAQNLDCYVRSTYYRASFWEFTVWVLRQN